MTEMKMTSLRIGKSYNDTTGSFNAVVEFEGYGHEIKVHLPAEVGRKVLDLCMNEVMAAVQNIANEAKNFLIDGPKEETKLIDNNGAGS